MKHRGNHIIMDININITKYAITWIYNRTSIRTNVTSEDGRGAIWWAWEYKNAEALAILAVNGVDLHYSQTDAQGKKPYELCGHMKKHCKKHNY